MKNQRAIVRMAVAIAFGLAAVALATQWLRHRDATNASASRIVVAATDITPGQRLTPEMLKLADWPKGSLPAGSFVDPVKATGRVLKTNVLRGDPVSEAKLAPDGTAGGLSAVITEGKRAITVRVNDVIGVAGFALPGNFVDVIVSTHKDSPTGERSAELNVSKIVLERILVLAVAQDIGRDETKPRVVNAVTLEVTPEQAEHLDLARSVGTLSLALRNQVDKNDTHSDGATKRSLLDEAPLLKLAAAAPPKALPRPVTRPVVLVKRHCVSVLNGVNISQECF
ncbi:Flp pilus assembly protein CpaB [Massilia sp. PWRC2]|uniref:Flp pilus assembly protein CpaB n=1 Tax=Massilia sp. PWRC2 TaxID=2804626 RepID=UPI003CFB8101